MNWYISLDTFKRSVGVDVQDSSHDAEMGAVLSAVSRQVDLVCQRRFYALQATRYFDSDGGDMLLLDGEWPDLIAVTSLATDEDGDGAYETTWASGDYLLLPRDARPISADPDDRPYHAIWAVPWGARRQFPRGMQRIEVVGEWGYGRHLRRATETVSGAVNATQATITVSSRADIEAGHTLLIGSEQVFVRSYNGSVLTVVRGVNGTTAATHGNGDVIDIYEYPAGVREAVRREAANEWRRRDHALARAQGMDGQFLVPQALQMASEQDLALYRLRVMA